MKLTITHGIIMAMMTLKQIGEKHLRCFFLKQGKRLSNLKDFTQKIDHFVQGLDMLSTSRLSQTLIHPFYSIKPVYYSKSQF